MKKIVVGVDEGKLSDAALDVGTMLADAFDANLQLVHAVPVEPVHRSNAEVTRWAKHVSEAIETSREHLEAHLNVRIDHPRFAEMPLADLLTVQPGRPGQVLVDLAEEGGADLIVLGEHRHRRFLDLGGTALSVLSAAHCPVWVQPTDFTDPKTILAPVDLSAHSEASLEFARTLAKATGAKVEVLYCFTAPFTGYELSEDVTGMVPPLDVTKLREEEARELDAFLARFDWEGIEHETSFVDGLAVDVILAREPDVDLVVMGTHGHTALVRAMLGSHARRILKRATGPVVAVPL